MRKIPIALVGLLGWLGSQGCVFVHDTDCATSADCTEGRICDAGSCVASSREGPTNPDDNGSGGTGGSKGPVPSCTDAPTGTQPAAPVSVASVCKSKVQSLTVKLSGDLIQTVDGRSCTLSKGGSQCYSVFPDIYECGGCNFKLSKETVGDQVAGYAVQAESCVTPGCADYCCSSDSGTRFQTMYWLGESGTPPITGGTGGTGGGGKPGCSGVFQSCEVCYQRCNDSCYEYPMGCIGPCYQACDKCCTRD